jgi:hypothetical protein
MIKSFTGAVAATALGLTLFGGGVASAVEKPVAGSTACTNVVNVNSDVKKAVSEVLDQQVVLSTAKRDGSSDAAINAAQAELTARQARLSNVVADVTASLCQDGPVTTKPEPTTTVVTPPRTIVQQPTTVVERPTVIDRERISTVAVVPTRDDGSVATVSGSQVTVVPEGSASTGEA